MIIQKIKYVLFVLMKENILRILKDDSLRDKLVDGTKREVNTTAETEPKKVMELLLS